MKICDIANGWKDKNLHFGVLFLRNLILIVKWQREVSERKVRNQVLSVHFLPLQEQGASVLVPHPLVPQHLPVKWELLNLPLNAKFYHVCKNWGPSRGKQSIQPHMPPCAPQECQWWHPVEQSRAGARNGATEEKGPLPAPDHLVMAAAKVGAWSIAFSSLLCFWKIFLPPYPQNLMFYPAGPKFECVPLHECPEEDRSLCPMAVQQWHSTLVFGSWLCHSSWGTVSLSRELTAIICVFNLPAVPGACFCLHVPNPGHRAALAGSPGQWQGPLAQESARQGHCRAGFGKEWVQWLTRLLTGPRAAHKGVTFWLWWQDKMGFDDFLSFLNSMQDSVLISVFLSSKVIIKGMSLHVQSRRWFGNVQQD